MAEIKELKLEDSTDPVDRRGTYVPPKLKVFGLVGALTQSGTGTPTEMASEINSMKVMG